MYEFYVFLVEFFYVIETFDFAEVYSLKLQ